MIRLLSKQCQIQSLSRFISSSSSHPPNGKDPVINSQQSKAQHQIQDFSFFSSRMHSLNNEDISLFFAQFSSKPRFLEAEKKISLDLLKEISVRLYKGQLNVDRFVSIAKNLEKYPESTTILSSVLKQFLEPKSPYLSMNELSKIIDLVFNIYKSKDYNLCKFAFETLDNKISHNYSSIHILDTTHTCLKMYSIYEDLTEMVSKLSYFIINKIEIQECEENLKLIQIYNECEETPRSYLNLVLNYFYEIKAEENNKLDIKQQMQAICEISQLANNRNRYVSYYFREFLLNELSSKLEVRDLNKVDYGLFFEAACMLNSLIPNKLVDCVENYFYMQKEIDYSYILCYMNLVGLKNIKEQIEIGENQEKGIKNLPTDEILKIFNLTINSKQNPFLKKINSLTHKVLIDTSKSENYEKIVELLKCIENQELHKKTISVISKDIESCLKYIQIHQKSINKFTYFKLLLNFYHRVPKITEHYLNEIVKNTEPSEIISYLHQLDNIKFLSLIDILKMLPNCTDNEKIKLFLINLNSNTTKTEFVDSAKIFNQLSGSVFLSQTFEIFIHKWFKYVHINKVEIYFRPFLHNLNKFMLSLPETELCNLKSLNTSKWLKIFGYLEDSLAEKVALANKNQYNNNQLVFMYIGLGLKNPEIQNLIKNFIIPEFFYSWHNAEIKPLILRIRIANEVIKDYPELSSKLLISLEDKINKWVNLFADDFIELSESLCDLEFCSFPEIISCLIDKTSNKIFKENLNLDGNFKVNFFNHYCKFPVKRSKKLGFLFSEIGKHYFKLTIEQKISILKACGSIGIANKEMFKVVFMDLQNIEDLNKTFAVDALDGLCDVNLEASDFSRKIFDDLANKINLNSRLLGHHTAKLIYCLTKAQKFDNVVKKFMELNKISPFIYLEDPQKLLISYFLLASKGLKIFNDEDFFQWDGLVSNFNLWKIPDSQLNKAINTLKTQNIQFEVFPVLNQIRVPLLIQSLKTIIIPKTLYNTTFNSDSLKGEQAMLVSALLNYGYKVHLHDFSTPFTLTP